MARLVYGRPGAHPSRAKCFALFAADSGERCDARHREHGDGLAMAIITIQSAGQARRTVALSEVVTTIGRSVDNVLEVPDANMSRRHCVIERRDDGDYIVTDCNSSNGTRVNGERVVSHELREGDRVEMGSTSILFSLDGDAPDASSSSAKGALAVLEESNPPNARNAMALKATPGAPPRPSSPPPRRPG